MLQCENFFGIIVLLFVSCLTSGSMMGLMVTSFKRNYTTCSTSQDCCCQSLCPHGRALLTQTDRRASHMQRQVWFSLSWGLLLLSLNPGAHKVLFVPSKSLWQVRGLILNAVAPLLLSCCSFSFALGDSYLFFWWVLTFSCQWLFSI